MASPHYLGEILSFVGYAMMSDLLPVWGNALVVSAYLASRANTTLKWYQSACTRSHNARLWDPNRSGDARR